MKTLPKGFEKFAKTGQATKAQSGFNSVIYTRVSTKEQADTNLSLQTQKKACEGFAAKNGYSVVAYFGGTFESAKSDERKEFKRMLDFVKKSRERISHIIVYSVDRFSRSGANAIFIASELQKVGISITSVTQPMDASTASGSLQQNIHFIFSEYDNQIRKEKCMAGMKEKLASGHWLGRPPFGYDTITTNGERRIVVNAKGKLLRKAFEWKANEGLLNVEIVERLAKFGLTLHHQKISTAFANPFYCGLISHNFLNGELVEGKHEKLVSKELFLRVNKEQSLNASGWKVFDENEHLPLKRFLHCQQCGKPLRGYMVKKKKIHYYKCGTTGCCVNESAKRLHQEFYGMLTNFTIDEKYVPVLRHQLEATVLKHNEDKQAEIELVVRDSKELSQKMERLEERYINEELNRDLFDKFMSKFKDEQAELQKRYETLREKTSNLQKEIETSLKIATKLPEFWLNSNYNTKHKIQQIVYPEGIFYDKKNRGCRTNRVNEVLNLIGYFRMAYEQKRNGIDNSKVEQSRLVPRAGVEPACQ